MSTPPLWCVDPDEHGEWRAMCMCPEPPAAPDAPAPQALDVERLAEALKTHQHSADVVGYCYKGHAEDALREAERIAAEYARLPSETGDE